MEQLWTCPISLENPTCQNLWCKSKYQLEKMGYGMSLVTLQPQFKIFIKITKIFMQAGKSYMVIFYSRFR